MISKFYCFYPVFFFCFFLFLFLFFFFVVVVVVFNARPECFDFVTVPYPCYGYNVQKKILADYFMELKIQRLKL